MVKDTILKMINHVERGYDNIYDINFMKFTLYFKTLPKMIERSDEAVIDQLKAEITNINRTKRFIE
ncbi:hypothetical protein RZS08_04115, partial [Arthrospira platensis SPKY1]|nr:hypothetical protein [Arthrospira platensis SPKY1]